MATTTKPGLGHIDIALPPPPDTSFFSETQWKVWYSLMDTIFPSIVSETAAAAGDGTQHKLTQELLDSYYSTTKASHASPPSKETFEAYLAETISDNETYRDLMGRTMAGLPADMRAQLGTLLTVLSTRLGSFPVTGYLRPFYDLPLPAREAVVQSWQTSYFTALRGFAKSVMLLGKKIWLQSSPLFQQLSGFKDLPDEYETGQPGGYTFKQFPAGDGPVVVDTDVVIVGSGCGGGVCARVLAEAGHRVIVVDKGYYFPPVYLPMKSEVAEVNLFENGGLMSSDDGSLAILAGSTWGGGGAVNWGVSLQTPQYVRDEWIKKRGLSWFGTSQFQDALDEVCRFMGVSADAVRQNHRGQVLLDGAAQLGWKAKVTPHNSGNAEHHCGHCHFGCGTAGKKGPAVSWLPAASRAGAEFIEGFQVDKVEFSAFASGKKASGISGRWTSRDKDDGVSGDLKERVTRNVVINAKRVIVSAGSLWSPVILKKSGLSNPQIGRNLYMHPVNVIGAFWKEDVKPWDGCAICSVVTTFENLDNEGHGTKLEPLCMLPSVVLPYFPWHNAVDFKLSLLKYRHLDAWFSMPRDRDTGYIYVDPTTGRPRVVYTPSAFDRAHAMEGDVAIARICYVQGAEEIVPFLPGVESFKRGPAGAKSDAEDARFEKWLQTLRSVGNPATVPWGCAHQMGSCRMSKAAEDGVVDPNGKVWGVENLYVADASVFPSASGVNPMVTNMAISYCTASKIAADLTAIKQKARMGATAFAAV
ncbi:long chain fatty alcohol oxidase [Xylariales sp. PMI_506]|nr:long chain fatty alcohol oxidase [Xylariales sp. PMI_506]